MKNALMRSHESISHCPHGSWSIKVSTYIVVVQQQHGHRRTSFA